jgi:ABC-type glycerol-3-phosphate transport system substrate-binding protein
MLQNNVSLTAPSGKPAEDVIDYYRNFVQSYGIWDPTLPSSTNMFASGKVGIYFGHSWRVFDLTSINPQLNYSVHPIPQLPVDADRGEQPINWASFWVEAVNSKSSNTTAAWELVKYLSTPEVLEKLYRSAVASGRPFGEPYSRVDMADKLINDPQVGPFISQAPQARSWYLASATNDGPTGINTLLSTAFAAAVNRETSITNLAAEVNKVLAQYGLAAPIPQAR